MLFICSSLGNDLLKVGRKEKKNRTYLSILCFLDPVVSLLFICWSTGKYVIGSSLYFLVSRFIHSLFLHLHSILHPTFRLIYRKSFPHHHHPSLDTLENKMTSPALRLAAIAGHLDSSQDPVSSALSTSVPPVQLNRDTLSILLDGEDQTWRKWVKCPCSLLLLLCYCCWQLVGCKGAHKWQTQGDKEKLFAKKVP